MSQRLPIARPDEVGLSPQRLSRIGDKSLELVAPRRPMTVQDLLRHTSGLTYGLFGDGLVKKAYQEASISASGSVTNAEFTERIARMPLAFQPGSTWDYSNATDVLGRVIEVASGQSLYQHLKVRLFDPLGMVDTSFYVPEPARQARIAEPWPDDRNIGVNAPVFDPRPVMAMESGGGGLVSTAPDYARFLQMLRNGGQLDGRRFLSPATLVNMTTDHLNPAAVKTPLYLPGPGYGFGLGFAVRTAAGEAAYPCSPGEYYRGGAGGPYMWVDPASDLFVVFMMQSPKQRVPYRSVLRNMVYGAITDSKPSAGRQDAERHSWSAGQYHFCGICDQLQPHWKSARHRAARRAQRSEAVVPAGAPLPPVTNRAAQPPHQTPPIADNRGVGACGALHRMRRQVPPPHPGGLIGIGNGKYAGFDQNYNDLRSRNRRSPQC